MPHKRHFVPSVTIPKVAGNSVFAKNVTKKDVIVDVKEINDGRATKVGNEFITSSGRVYGYHNNIVYPKRGPRIIELSSPQYNLLVLFKKDATKGHRTKAIITKKGIMSKDDADQVEELARQFGLI
jgi:hypothetical protein